MANYHSSTSLSTLSLTEKRDNEPITPAQGWGPITRTQTQRTGKYLEGEDLINLPSRTLGPDADLEEYTQETVDGQILKEVKSHKSGLIERYELVTWRIDDPENPKNWRFALHSLWE